MRGRKPNQENTTPTPRQVESFNHMQNRNPVETQGTTEVRTNETVITETNDSIQQRYAEAEKQKEKDIETLKKQSDGKPLV